MDPHVPRDLPAIQVPLAATRPVDDLTELQRGLPAGAQLRSVYAGFATQDNGFYQSIVDLSSPVETREYQQRHLTDTLRRQISDLANSAQHLHDNPSSSSSVQAIASRAVSELELQLERLAGGVPTYALTFSTRYGDELAPMLDDHFPGSTLAVVAIACEPLQPLYPDEALNAWSSLVEREERDTSPPRAAPIDPLAPPPPPITGLGVSGPVEERTG